MLEKEYGTKYTELNRSKINEYNAQRRHERLGAIPSNIRDVDKSTIKDVYELAKEQSLELNKKFEVDHIIPLKNKNICGLNVSWNLQILTREDNSRKKNKFDGTNENTSWRIK